MPTRRLYRRWMIEWLEAFRRRTIMFEGKRVVLRKASFCQFAALAYKIRNPEFKEDVKLNFANLEAMAGYVGRTILMENQRPDRNITYYFNRSRHFWNLRPINHYGQLDVIPHDVIEYRKPTKKDPKDREEVTYNYLEVTRGDDAVGQIERRFDNMDAGIERTRERKRDSIDVQSVDDRIAQIFREVAELS